MGKLRVDRQTDRRADRRKNKQTEHIQTDTHTHTDTHTQTEDRHMTTHRKTSNRLTTRQTQATQRGQTHRHIGRTDGEGERRKSDIGLCSHMVLGVRVNSGFLFFAVGHEICTNLSLCSS
jgi:hypothetical protein